MPSTPLTETEIQRQLQELSGWVREGDAIQKEFQFESYVAGLAFATAVGIVCEGLNHHPDMNIGWKKVTLRFTTHDAGSQLTGSDFTTAAAVERLGYPHK